MGKSFCLYNKRKYITMHQQVQLLRTKVTVFERMPSCQYNLKNNAGSVKLNTAKKMKKHSLTL